MTSQAPTPSVFSPFAILKTTYKTVLDHPISVSVLILKAILSNTSSAESSKPCPVVVKFHGGFLVTGDAMYPDWFPQWLAQYTLQHNAIVVLPNHRLLPEATGLEILDDIHDFWKWVENDLWGFVKQHTQGLEIDLGRTLVTGESAGGYLSIQSALGSSSGVSVAACIATYPVLDFASRFYSEEYEKVILGASTLPKEILANHLKAIEEDAKNGERRVVSSATPPERLPIALSLVQQGQYLKLLGDDRILYPFQRIEDVKAERVPPILILHGRDDSAVPIEGSQRWTQKAKGLLGDDRVELLVQPGEHGFDTDPSITLETPWLKSSLIRITKAWLGKE